MQVLISQSEFIRENSFQLILLENYSEYSPNSFPCRLADCANHTQFGQNLYEKNEYAYSVVLLKVPLIFINFLFFIFCRYIYIYINIYIYIFIFIFIFIFILYIYIYIVYINFWGGFEFDQDARLYLHYFLVYICC